MIPGVRPSRSKHPAVNLTESILFGKPVQPKGSATSWWIGKPREGFTAEGMARAVSVSAQHRGPAREGLLTP